jgi:hypothetical protein
VSAISDLIREAWTAHLMETTSPGTWYAQHAGSPGHWKSAKALLDEACALADGITSQLPVHGVATGATITKRPPDWAWELDQIVQLGGGLVRFDYGSGQDWLVQECLNRGLSPLLLFAPGATVATVTTALNTWKGKLQVIEVGGNEPNVNGQTPTQHAMKVQALSQAARNIDPNVQVINGGLAPGSGTLAYALALVPLLKGYIDHFNMHLYEDAYVLAMTWSNSWNACFDPQVLAGKQSIRQCLDVNGMVAVPICSTESGATVRKVSEAQQAQTVANAYERAATLRRSGDMSFLLTYTIRDDEDPKNPGYGLCRLDKSKRPAWTAAQQGFAL